MTDIRAELRRVTAERDTLSSVVHMLRADADRLRMEPAGLK